MQAKIIIEELKTELPFTSHFLAIKKRVKGLILVFLNNWVLATFT
jgi:hypothetical protein